MRNFRRTAIASVINLALLGISDAQAADTEAMERRIRELESRLAKMDQLEARLEKLDQAGALSAKPATAVITTAPAAPSPEVEKLNRKVNTLERKLEVQDEVTTGIFAKLPKFDAGDNGFRITSADKKHQVRLRGAMQADGRYFVEDDHHLNTTSFDLKQARVWVEGYVFKDIYYKIMPDFAASGNILPDAYLDYGYFTPAQLLAGKFKPSISLERLQGDSDGTFLERAFPTYLASNRDVGIQVHGAFARPGSGYSAVKVPGPIDTSNFFTYQLAVDNGSGDDGSPNNNGGATFDNKEFVGRVFMQPFMHTGYSWLEGLGIGLAGTTDNPSNQALKNQATPIGRTTYLNYEKNTYNNAAAPTSNGTRHRIYPQAYWYAGPWGAMAEYAVSSQHLTGTNQAGQLVNVQQNNKAWQFFTSYVLTGEHNTFGAVKPIQNFSPLDGKWGAWQLAARWTEMAIDNSTFQIIDPNKAPNHATAWTLGVNWYLNPYALVRADYEQVSFQGGAANGGDRPTEQVFATRFQLSF
ncbi:MAG: porin [Methylococcaceae bacterium]|jgi:phosphate-selective porin OprO/OprP